MPHPTFAKALAILFVTVIVNSVLGLIITFSGVFGSIDPTLLQLMLWPVGVFVMAAMTSLILPTDFAKGFLVALLHVVVSIAVICVGIMIVVSIMMFVRLMAP